LQRLVYSFLLVLLTTGRVVPAAADVNVSRTGSENPVQEVAKSIFWGGIAGLMVGGALAVATSDSDNDGDYIRAGFVGGVLFGAAFGIYHVTSRPRALLEIEHGQVNLAAAPFVEVRHPAPASPAPGMRQAPGIAARLVALSL
jgi:hypothetical protein